MKRKTLDIIDKADAISRIPDVNIYGNGDTFQLLCKASSEEESWSKSTKVCNVPGGCIVQVTTVHRNPDLSCSVAEGLTFVPSVHIDINATPRVLIAEPA